MKINDALGKPLRPETLKFLEEWMKGPHHVCYHGNLVFGDGATCWPCNDPVARLLDRLPKDNVHNTWYPRYDLEDDSSTETQ